MAAGGLIDVVFPASPVYTLAATCSDVTENSANYLSDYFICTSVPSNYTI